MKNSKLGNNQVIGIPHKYKVVLNPKSINQSPNRLMTIPVTRTNTTYYYMCPLCGNDFTLHHECEPEYCHGCRQNVSFMVEKEEVTFTIVEQYCPVCDKYFKTSDYINTLFRNDPKARWLANMVTHHRHEHITSWNKNWSRNGYARNHLNVDYDKEKRKFNERAKRQILRKCKNYMIQNGFSVEDVSKLKGTEQKTIELYRKHLPTKSQNYTTLN